MRSVKISSGPLRTFHLICHLTGFRGVVKKQGFKCSYCSQTAHKKCCSAAGPCPYGVRKTTQAPLTIGTGSNDKIIEKPPQHRDTGQKNAFKGFTDTEVNNVMNSFFSGKETPDSLWKQATKHCEGSQLPNSGMFQFSFLFFVLLPSRFLSVVFLLPFFLFKYFCLM